VVAKVEFHAGELFPRVGFGEDGRPVGQARPVLLVAAGREPSPGCPEERPGVKDGPEAHVEAVKCILMTSWKAKAVESV